MNQAAMRDRMQPLTRLILELAVVCSVFSQIAPLAHFMRPAMYASWMIVLFWGVVYNKGKIPTYSFSQIFFISFILFCALCGIVGMIEPKHLSASYLRVLVVPLMVTIAGDMFVDEDRELINRLGRVYLLCSVIFAFWVHRTYFPSYSIWLNAKVYQFLGKNSAGQIWVSAIFVSILLLDYKSSFERAAIYVLCLYLLVMTGFSQCRTAILGTVVAIMFYLISRAQHKSRWILLALVFAIAAWQIPATHRFLEQALLLNKYDGTDLNTFSSGRVANYGKAFKAFMSNPFFGVGNYYVDCSYLLILAESGIIGFVLIEWIWIKKISICFRYRGELKGRAFLFMSVVFYLVESILEGFPPFGPGVSSFMFWLLSAMIINRVTQSDSQEFTAGNPSQIHI